MLEIFQHNQSIIELEITVLHSHTGAVTAEAQAPLNPTQGQGTQPRERVTGSTWPGHRSEASSENKSYFLQIGASLTYGLILGRQSSFVFILPTISSLHPGSGCNSMAGWNGIVSDGYTGGFLAINL